MPQEQQEFLQAVAEGRRRRKRLNRIAKDLGIHPSTLTYRLNSAGYRVEMQVVHIVTGEPLETAFPGDDSKKAA